eukprot:418901-Amphidinium_carterae.1
MGCWSPTCYGLYGFLFPESVSRGPAMHGHSPIDWDSLSVNIETLYSEWLHYDLGDLWSTQSSVDAL